MFLLFNNSCEDLLRWTCDLFSCCGFVSCSFTDIQLPISSIKVGIPYMRLI